MRFRQVHLDFHTSEAIKGIGKSFSREQFQSMLKLGHVNHMTIFAKCHHGVMYYPSETGPMHPHLSFDLLGEMIAAAKELDVYTPIYISAGFDEHMARLRPDWLAYGVDEHGNPSAPRFDVAGYKLFCFNTGYLDYLIKQVEEVLVRYQPGGIFLDIVAPRNCLCPACQKTLLDEGKDLHDAAEVAALGERIYRKYTAAVQAAVDRLAPGTAIFHNAGHIQRGRRDLAQMNSHLELESLPTGGWGYDHFPLSARYAQGLGMQTLGMTGKFHTTWGEFGGYKHPNALRYEVALDLANGMKCNVGDQMHPEGFLDPATYALIGTAFAEAEKKEPWCENVKAVADIGVLSVEAASGTLADRHGGNDAGVVRMLLEGHYQFDVLDLEYDFTKYKVIILPDLVRIDASLKRKLDAFLLGGGKILATGESGLYRDKDAFAFDFGACYEGKNPFNPDYARPLEKHGALEPAAFVMYGQGQRIASHDGDVLAWREDPYFNREFYHFCSHQHTPNRLDAQSPGVIAGKDGVYIAWTIFDDYYKNGSYPQKMLVHQALDRLLEGKKSLVTNLPVQGIATIMEQPDEKRYICHLLYASPVKRGRVEVIEDILPVHDVSVTLRLPKTVTRAYLAPEQQEIPLKIEGDEASFTLKRLECHQMVVVE